MLDDDRGDEADGEDEDVDGGEDDDGDDDDRCPWVLLGPSVWALR